MNKVTQITIPLHLKYLSDNYPMPFWWMKMFSKDDQTYHLVKSEIKKQMAPKKHKYWYL